MDGMDEISMSSPFNSNRSRNAGNAGNDWERLGMDGDSRECSAMGMMSRNKGKAGEREIASLLADLTGFDVRRRVRQRDGDSDLEGIPGWVVEVKRHAKATRASIRAWWAPGVRQLTPLFACRFQ